MKILSFNVRVWWRDTEKPDTKHYWRFRMEAIKEFINEKNPDIICFQELWWPARKYLPENYKRVGFSVSHSIYIRDDAPVKVLKHRWRLHYDFAQVLLHDYINMSLASVHSHWNAKVLKRNCKNLMSDAAKTRTYPLVFVGDWNNFPDEVCSNLNKKIAPQGELTGYSFENWKTGARSLIDIFFTRGVIIPKIEYFDFERGEYVMSDHRPVMMTFL